MKSFKEILRSPAFMREVSNLFIGLAALSVVFSLLLFAGGNSDPDALSLAGGFLVQAIIYVVLGVMIRRGSVKALWRQEYFSPLILSSHFFMRREPAS